MKSEPPALATWLLEHIRFSNTDEALAGDLLEAARGIHARTLSRLVLVASAAGDCCRLRKGGTYSLDTGDSSNDDRLECQYRC